ncbi:MAG: hypothetical protein JJU33_11145 [Phycisphaerales bacterium]|nr:hypothetical protein [Phycisphaerales bacterium]
MRSKVLHRVCAVSLGMAVWMFPALGADDKPAVDLSFRVADEPSVTRHSVTIDGRELSYTAMAGRMELPAYDGQTRAELSFIAYTLDGDHGPEDRPLTFSFNGGPGSSSVWLHLGTLGPRRVLMDDEGMPLPPPGRVVDNEFSWLDLTDMVFIDPVGTGYSRAEEGVRPTEFFGLREDIEAVGEFIRLWVTRNERWSSPKFLIGESYGTTRAAGLSGYLQETHGMYLNGVILVSPVLNFQTIRFNVGNEMPYWLFLPTYAATAFYHGRLEPALSEDLRALMDEVEEFAETEYLVALAKGDRLTMSERDEIASKLARYTGLSKRYIEQTDLRIDIFRFTKELLRDEGLTVGRLDSRYKGRDRLDVGDRYEYDPSYSAILGPYSTALNDYMRRELKYVNDHPYEILTGRVRPWSYAQDQNRYANVAESLRSAMNRNRDLHAWFACGYYDLATPHFAAEYTISHMQLDPELRKQVMLSHYEAGHMMYLRIADLEKLKVDAVEFYRQALGD